MATRLRVEGNEAARNLDYETALRKYTEAIDLGPETGLHVLYANR